MKINRTLSALFLSVMLCTAFACRENNPKAKTPADENQMEGVRESKEDAMEKAKERAGTYDPAMNPDSIAKKDRKSNAKDSTGN